MRHGTSRNTRSHRTRGGGGGGGKGKKDEWVGGEAPVLHES